MASNAPVTAFVRLAVLVSEVYYCRISHRIPMGPDRELRRGREKQKRLAGRRNAKLKHFLHVVFSATPVRLAGQEKKSCAVVST